MNIKEWEKQREKDIEKGSCSMLSLDPIQICLEDCDIVKIIEDYDLKEIDTDLWLVHEQLKFDLYMNKLENTPKAIRSWLFEKNRELKEMFPKFYWAEYVANTMYERNYTFEDMINYTGLMGDIYDYLKSHPKTHGITGEGLQNNARLSKLIEGMTGMTFTWRSWGALMAAFMNTKERERKYTYMSFYMD